jgi:hypothetical protein
VSFFGGQRAVVNVYSAGATASPFVPAIPGSSSILTADSGANGSPNDSVIARVS